MTVLGWVVRSMFKYWRQTVQVFQHAFREENPEWTEITVEELYERLESNPPDLLIDVRPVEDYNDEKGHLPNAVSIPMLELESRIDEVAEYKDKEIVTMCPGGGLSLVAVDILQEAGFKDVKSLKEGTDGWINKGYPITNA